MRPMPELAVEEMPTEELLPYANNAKIHTNEQIDQIIASIEEFGFNDPVAVWDNPKGGTEIVEGHGRVIAAKRMGLGKLPVIRLDHLSDEQRRAYTHVHNQLTLNTGWDLDKLSLELGDLEGFDWDGFGFDPFQDDDEAASLDGLGDDMPDESEVVCRCKPGDVWLCGDHRIMCGSSASADDMAVLMGG